MRFLGFACVSLIACGGGSTDVDPTLVFADRSDLEVGRLLNAAAGTDMFGAQTNVDRFADEQDPCPVVSYSGRSVTITGGCTTADGIAIRGSATVTNPLAWDQIEYEFGTATTYQFQALELEQQGFVQTFDGVMTIEDFQTWDADVVVGMLGITVRSDIHYECDGSSCELDGSGIELVGAGGALVSGEVLVSGTREASYTLRGADTLTATVSAGCVAWRISGTDRQQVCAN